MAKNINERMQKASPRLTERETARELAEVQDFLLKRFFNVINDEVDRVRIIELCHGQPLQEVQRSPGSFEQAVATADRQYAGDLWDAELSSSGRAMHDVAKASVAERAAIIARELQQWRDQSVECIREWAPRYFNIAATFLVETKETGAPSQWTKNKLISGVNRRFRLDTVGAPDGQ